MEFSTATRLILQKGLNLTVSSHQGAEVLDAAGKTYDFMGSAAAFQKGKMGEIIEAIGTHLQKSVDYVVVDLKGASKEQIKKIKDHVAGLSEGHQARITYVN